MIGGSPIPVYPTYPQAGPPSYPQAPRPVAVRPQPRPAPTVRGQKAEEPRTLAAMPTPEQLGVALPKPADWTELRVRLDRLGASQFTLVKNDGGWRFACQLPGGRSLEGHGATDADAVSDALNKSK